MANKGRNVPVGRVLDTVDDNDITIVNDLYGLGAPGSGVPQL